MRYAVKTFRFYYLTSSWCDVVGGNNKRLVRKFPGIFCLYCHSSSQAIVSDELELSNAYLYLYLTNFLFKSCDIARYRAISCD